MNVLGTDTYLWSVYYYDDKGNLTGEWKQHYLGGPSTAGKFDDIKREYTFTGQLEKETRKHHTTSTTSPEVTVVTEYGYDHRGRPLQTWKTVMPKGATEGRRILLSENTYNEVGQLYARGLHSDTEGEDAPAQVTLDGGDVVSAGQERTVRAETSVTLSPGFHAQQGSYFHAAIGGGFGQEIRYAYNERGWLSSAGSGLFRQTLRYADTAANRQYNGNISHQVFSRRASTGSQPAWLTDTYSYTYDGVNRLLQGAMTGNKGRETLTYDRNGNIRTLVRTGTGSTAVDELTLDYTGNRLTGVADGAPSSDGSYQLPGTTVYTYDANGNVTKRENSGSTANNITGITYNYLNLPQSVTAAAGNVTYVYDATGRKLRSAGGIVGQTRDYIDGIEYYNGTMELIHTGEGRIMRSGSVYEYDYFIRDHLGNNRTGFREGSDVTVPNFTVDYYAFGLPYRHSSFSRPGSPKNNYLYNGKELQDGIKQYDYGARFYDPVIGRWQSVDPLAELGRKWSPYNYAQDNPIRLIDPDGRWVTDTLGNLSTTDEEEIADVLNQMRSQTDKERAKDPEYGAWRKRTETARNSYGTTTRERASNWVLWYDWIFQEGAFEPMPGMIESSVGDNPVGWLAMGPAGWSKEVQIINEAKGILKESNLLINAFKAGKGVELKIGGRTIIVEPEAPMSGMTLFGERAFVLGKDAFASGQELAKTILHELYRLANSAGGATSGAKAAQETKAAASFAEEAAKKLK